MAIDLDFYCVIVLKAIDTHKWPLHHISLIKHIQSMTYAYPSEGAMLIALLVLSGSRLKAFEQHHRLSSCKHDPMFAKH